MKLNNPTETIRVRHKWISDPNQPFVRYKICFIEHNLTSWGRGWEKIYGTATDGQLDQVLSWLNIYGDEAAHDIMDEYENWAEEQEKNED